MDDRTLTVNALEILEIYKCVHTTVNLCWKDKNWCLFLPVSRLFELVSGLWFRMELSWTF